MIGYVLLVVIAIVMSMIVFQFIRTYVPKDLVKCSDGVSIFIQETKYDCDADTLEVTIKNNGRFNVAGYFIHATTSDEQELATLDLSGNVSTGGEDYRNSILFALGNENLLSTNDVKKTTFSDVYGIHKIQIIPVRFQDEEGKTRFASCGDAKVGEVLSCWGEPEACEPDCSGRVCGLDSVCGEICPPNDCGTDVCNSSGQCVPPEECTDTCSVPFGYECGTWEICGVLETCVPGCDPATEECTPLGQCEVTCGNGEIDTGETCDDGGTTSGDGCNSTCQIETYWFCVGEPSDCSYCNSDGICETILGENCLCPDCEAKKNGCNEGYVCESGSCVQMPAVDSCKSYCSYLGYNSTDSHCAQNCGGACNGICEPYDESVYCTSPQSYCCCVPYA